MKKFLLFMLFVCIFNSSNAQLLGSQSIDTDVLVGIISKKQDEIKKRFLSNLVLKSIKTSNQTSFLTLYKVMDIITTEKNKTVMSQNLIKRLSEYALVYYVSYNFYNKYKTDIDGQFQTSPDQPTDEKSFFAFTVKEKVTSDANGKGLQYKDTHEDYNNKVNPLEYNPTKAAGSTKLKSNISQIDFINFIIDTVYSKLSVDKSLVKLGLFDDNKLGYNFKTTSIYNDPYDKDELTKIYTGLIVNSQPINSEIDKYIATVNTVANATGEIKEVLKFDFKDLGASTNKAILGAIIKNLNVILEEFTTTKTSVNQAFKKITGIITKYFIFDLSEEEEKSNPYKFKVDVEAIILDLEDNFFNNSKLAISNISNHCIGIRPFFSIGVNMSVSNGFEPQGLLETNPDYAKISNMAFAGEKIGLKFVWYDFKYTRSHKPNEVYKYRGKYYSWNFVKPKPFISNIYTSLWGSGLIYNAVNLKTEDRFNTLMFGLGVVGVEFFNGLDVNFSVVLPTLPDPLGKVMYNFALDIPIFEYIRELRKK